MWIVFFAIILIFVGLYLVWVSLRNEKSYKNGVCKISGVIIIFISFAIALYYLSYCNNGDTQQEQAKVIYTKVSTDENDNKVYLIQLEVEGKVYTVKFLDTYSNTITMGIESYLDSFELNEVDSKLK